jgi:hypothetical protein
MATWPTDVGSTPEHVIYLPAPQWSSWSEDRQDNVLRSATDYGPGKTRRRFTAVSRYQTCRWVFNSEQLQIFQDWWETEIFSGALSFFWMSPTVEMTVKARFRKPYTFKPFGEPMVIKTPEAEGEPKYIYGLWEVNGELEILP